MIHWEMEGFRLVQSLWRPAWGVGVGSAQALKGLFCGVAAPYEFRRFRRFSYCFFALQEPFSAHFCARLRLTASRLCVTSTRTPSRPVTVAGFETVDLKLGLVIFQALPLPSRPGFPSSRLPALPAIVRRSP